MIICLESILKTSRKRLEDVLKTYDQYKCIGLDQKVLKTSSADEDERHLQDVFKMHLSRQMFAGSILLRDYDIETNNNEIMGVAAIAEKQQ